MNAYQHHAALQAGHAPAFFMGESNIKCYRLQPNVAIPFLGFEVPTNAKGLVDLTELYCAVNSGSIKMQNPIAWLHSESVRRTIGYTIACGLPQPYETENKHKDFYLSSPPVYASLPFALLYLHEATNDEAWPNRFVDAIQRYQPPRPALPEFRQAPDNGGEARAMTSTAHALGINPPRFKQLLEEMRWITLNRYRQPVATHSAISEGRMQHRPGSYVDGKPVHPLITQKGVEQLQSLIKSEAPIVRPFLPRKKIASVPAPATFH